jgi:hypothetical protein
MINDHKSILKPFPIHDFVIFQLLKAVKPRKGSTTIASEQLTFSGVATVFRVHQMHSTIYGFDS